MLVKSQLKWIWVLRYLHRHRLNWLKQLSSEVLQTCWESDSPLVPLWRFVIKWRCQDLRPLSFWSQRASKSSIIHNPFEDQHHERIRRSRRPSNQFQAIAVRALFLSIITIANLQQTWARQLPSRSWWYDNSFPTWSSERRYPFEQTTNIRLRGVQICHDKLSSMYEETKRDERPWVQKYRKVVFDMPDG